MKKKDYMFRVITIIAVLLVTALVFSACGSSPSMPTSSTTTALETTAAPETTAGSETTAAPETTVSPETATKEEKPEDIINLDVLKNIESQDTFEVKVTKKEVKTDYFNDVSLSGNDVALFTITNNASYDIQEVTIFALAYNKDQEMVKLGSSAFISGLGEDPYVLMLTTQDTTITAGKSEEVGYRCRIADEEIAGVQVIVYSYKTSDGTEYTNDSAVEWYRDHKADDSIVFD